MSPSLRSTVGSPRRTGRGRPPARGRTRDLRARRVVRARPEDQDAHEGGQEFQSRDRSERIATRVGPRDLSPGQPERKPTGSCGALAFPKTVLRFLN